MASAFGIAVTNITSRFGILSRKACIRLATETGEKVIARKNELGRNLNKAEVEQVFSEILPKACRPKVITTDNEVYECLRRSGLTNEQIAAQLKSGEEMAMVAANVGNGTNKMAYWIPYERHAQIKNPIIKQYLEKNFPALIAHEMEHSLEKNCRIKDIFRRKFSKIKIALHKLFDKNYMEKVNQRQLGVHEFEGKMQESLSVTGVVDTVTGDIKVKCKPTVEDISEFYRKTCFFSLEYRLKGLIRSNYASALNQGSETNKRLKLLKYWLDMERPAYEVTGQIERKIAGLKEGEYALNEIVAKGYEASLDIVKKERRTYWIHKFFGKLKKPNIYMSDKDILRYAANKEEKQILADLIKDMSVEQKKKFIQVLSSFEGQPDSIKILNQYVKAITANGENFWLKSLKHLEGINLKMLSNPDFIKIAEITGTQGFSVYENALQKISYSKPENIKKFAEIADKYYMEELHMCDRNVKRQNFIYQLLAQFLDSPNFNELKAFCEIKVNGRAVYSDSLPSLNLLPSEKIKALLELAQKSAQEGKSVSKEIRQAIEEISKTN